MSKKGNQLAGNRPFRSDEVIYRVEGAVVQLVSFSSITPHGKDVVKSIPSFKLNTAAVMADRTPFRIKGL